jgi:hypothetical protein
MGSAEAISDSTTIVGYLAGFKGNIEIDFN